MTPKESAPSISQEELDNRRRLFARIEFLKQLDNACQEVRTDLQKIWTKLEPRIRAAVSALQDQVDEAFDPAKEEIEAEYDSQVRRAVSISGLQTNVWSWYRSAPQDPDTLRSELEVDIREWARGHKIESDWIRDTAIENIQHWPPRAGSLLDRILSYRTLPKTQLQLPILWAELRSSLSRGGHYGDGYG